MFHASKFKLKLKKNAASGTGSIKVNSSESDSVFSKGKLELDDKKFTEIREFIYDNSGIYFNDSKKYLLENRLSKRVEELKLKGYDEYFYYIRFDKMRKKELVELFNAITINETSFFRNEPQIDAFAKEILPEVISNIKKSGRKELKIWSAASSSGEEPYTLSLILEEMYKQELATLNVKVYGTDLSTDILKQAQKGIYNEYSIRNVPKNYMDNYFKKDDNRYLLSDVIKKYVDFRQANLVDTNDMNMYRGIDIIFCRNVLIYFDTSSKTKVVSKLYDNLNSGGYLFIGHSESLHGISKAFKLVHFNKSIAYKKE
jgi:chemotaxis protein methyltransferase CheR